MIAPVHPTPPTAGGETVERNGSTFAKRFLASETLCFAGWWSIFAGTLALNSICAIYGSASCPVGIGVTGILAGLLAETKQWGGRLIGIIKRCKNPSMDDDTNSTCLSYTDSSHRER